MQDQAFPDWASASAWASILEINCKITRRGCAVDFVSQSIENLNVGLTSAAQIDELVQKDWAKVGMEKQQRKDLRNGLSSFVKAAKANQQRRAFCLA